MENLFTLAFVIVMIVLWAVLFYKVGFWAGRSHDWLRIAIALVLAILFGTALGWVAAIVGFYEGNRGIKA